MSEAIRIVPAAPEHLDSIVDLERRSFPNPWRPEFYEGEFVADFRFNRVALDPQGNLVGYVFAMVAYDEMHINKIAVYEALRRSGIATRLMAVCIDHAQRSEIATMSLEVRESNESAQAFYRKLQFAPLYVRKGYYPDGESAVVMVASITAQTREVATTERT